MSGAPTAADWLELLAVLGLGAAAVIGLTALVERWMRSAVWRRTLWQSATVAPLVLLAVELTGAGGAMSHGALRLATTLAGALRMQTHEAGLPLTDAAAGPVQREEAFLSDESTVLDVGPVELVEPESDQRALPVATDWATESTLGPSVAALDAPKPPQPRVAERLAPGANHRLRTPLGWWPGAVWAAGTTLAAVWFVASRVLLALCRRGRWCGAAPALCERVTGLARRLGMRRRVTVVRARSLAGPIAFGVVRPTIVLPAQFDEQYDAVQQDAIVAHELAHLAAGDPAWYALSDVAAAALWWHPLVWWSRARLRASSELAADEASQVVADGPRVLAACLVALGERITRRPAAGWARMAGSGFRSGLGRRVERLMQLDGTRWSRPRRLLRWPAILFGVLLFSIIICGGTTWARLNSFETGDSTMNPMHSAWRKSLAGMLVAGTLAWTHPATLPAQDEASPAVSAADSSSDFGQAADGLLAKPQKVDAAHDAADEKPTQRDLNKDNDSVVEITLTVDGRSAQAEAQVKQILELLGQANGVHVVVNSADQGLDDSKQSPTTVLDPPKRDSGTISIRVFRLKHRNPDEVAAIIGGVLQPLAPSDAYRAVRIATVLHDPSLTRIVVDPRTRSLVVRGTEEHLKKIAALVKTLDVADGASAVQSDGLRVLPLRHAKAQEVADLLRNLGMSAQIMPDERLNRLLIAGTPEQMAEVEAVIKQLDVQSPKPADASGASVEQAERGRFLVGAGIDSNNSVVSSSVRHERASRTVFVTDSGKYVVDREFVDRNQIDEKLRGVDSARIVAHPGASYGRVRYVIDACTKAGIQDVRVDMGVLSHPPDEGAQRAR